MTALQGSPLDKEKTGLDSCVHCGFCLQACPTYIALEDENESPRGRLLLMGALLEGTVAPNDAEVGRHLDQCLGCRGCETACPAGVPYGRLLEATRATLIEHRPLPFLARLVLGIFARPWALRLALWGARILRASGLASLLGRVLPARVAMPFAMLASTARPAPRRDAAAAMQNGGGATLLTGCVMEGLLPSVNRATERVLARQGWTVHATEGQRCCGALHAHAGDAVGARALARANIAAFERPGDSTIVMNSAGCGAMCKEYGHLLADDPQWSARANAFAARVRDVHELLVPLAPAAMHPVTCNTASGSSISRPHSSARSPPSRWSCSPTATNAAAVLGSSTSSVPRSPSGSSRRSSRGSPNRVRRSLRPATRGA